MYLLTSPGVINKAGLTRFALTSLIFIKYIIVEKQSYA